MADVKVSILEKDGTEYDGPTEYTLLAEDVPFDNSSNGFTANKTQEAIEEAKASGEVAKDLPRFPFVLVHNGGLSDGQAIRWSNLANTAVLRVPTKAKVREITFGNNNNADADFRFYKNSVSAPNLFFTWTAIRSDSDALAVGDGADFTSPTFDQGDILEIRYDDQGASINDMIMVIWWQTVE